MVGHGAGAERAPILSPVAVPVHPAELHPECTRNGRLNDATIR
jgi:hypothetical protein